jgi:hypothetical protein
MIDIKTHVGESNTQVEIIIKTRIKEIPQFKCSARPLDSNHIYFRNFKECKKNLNLKNFKPKDS